MTASDCKKKIEQELIEEFILKFEEKIGYKPTVITDKEMTNDGLIILTLNELENYFTPFLPKTRGRDIKLGSKDRTRSLVELRCIFFFIARSMNYTLKRVGQYLGGRDHTTVIHNITTFKNLYDTDEIFKMKYNTILKTLKNDHHEPSTLEHTDKVELES